MEMSMKKTVRFNGQVFIGPKCPWLLPTAKHGVKLSVVAVLLIQQKQLLTPDLLVQKRVVGWILWRRGLPCQIGVNNLSPCVLEHRRSRVDAIQRYIILLSFDWVYVETFHWWPSLHQGDIKLLAPHLISKNALEGSTSLDFCASEGDGGQIIRSIQGVDW